MISGLSVVGGVLLVACNPPTATVYRLDKSSGAQITADHPTMTFKGAPALSDLECDPVSFSGSGFSATRRNIDAVWSKIAATQRVQAFWVPPATCGLPATETVFAPAACPDSPPAVSPYAAYRNADGSPIDSDGDGLSDEFELRIGTNPQNPDTDGDGYGDDAATVSVKIRSTAPRTFQTSLDRS